MSDKIDREKNEALIKFIGSMIDNSTDQDKWIHISKLESLIHRNKNKIFSCMFIKKDGFLRKMTCRLGVTKGVKGTGKPIHNKSNSYLTVFDIQKDQFRVINLQTMLLIKIGGKEYYVNQEK